jgi:large subunit ribosomal protein L4
MAKLDVINLSNQKVGEIELADAVFGAEVNEALIYEAVRHYLACQRRGTAATKVRGSVAGSGKKLWRQKGTGRARVGSVRSPLWRHGGTVHGPQPRDYSYALPRKMQLGALRSALTAKLKDGHIKVVNELAFADHKSKHVAGALATINGGKERAKKILVVDNAANRNFELGARNLPGVKLVATKDVNTYDLLNSDSIILTQTAAEKLSQALTPKPTTAKQKKEAA